MAYPSIASARWISQFAILEPIGAGGMSGVRRRLRTLSTRALSRDAEGLALGHLALKAESIVSWVRELPECRLAQ
jgi:hypothetical protein